MLTIQSIVRFDLAVSLFLLQNKFSHSIARISKAISHTGDGHLYVMIGVCAFVLDEHWGRIFLCTGLLAFAIELPIYWYTKNRFRRKRPVEFSNQLISFIKPSDKYSLPSGHTAAAFVMATLFGEFYPSIYIVALLWATLIGLSRILLGVHFFTDVVIGAVLGFGSAQSAFYLLGV